MYVRRLVVFYVAALLALSAMTVPAMAQNGTDGGDGGTEPTPVVDVAIGEGGPDESDLVDGNEVWLWADIENPGDETVDAELVLHLDGEELARQTFTLAPGGFQTLDTPWIAVAGEHTLEAEADPSDALAEDDEANNVATFTFTVAETTEDRWVVDEWCDENGRWQVEYEYSDGHFEVHDEGSCDEGAGGGTGGDGGWIVDTWCEGSDRVEEWEDDTGARWQDRFYDPGCEDGSGGDGYDDPYGGTDEYGCDRDAGEWWDHYLAACVSDVCWDIMDDFHMGMEPLHREHAQKIRALDTEIREKEIRLQQNAMELERAGDFEGARDAWDELDRYMWETDKRYHELDQWFQSEMESHIQEYESKAEGEGCGYLSQEFENAKFMAQPAPQPMDGPHGTMGGMDCPPPGGHMEGEYGDPYGDPRHDDPYRDDDPYASHEDPYGDDPYGDGPYGDDPYDDTYGYDQYDEGHRDGPDCGPGGPGGPMDHGMDYGLPEEAQAEMQRIRLQCEERMWALDDRMFSAETYDDRLAIEEEMRAAERDCRDKMEAVFQEYDRGYEDDFDRQFGGFDMQESSDGSSVDVRGANSWFVGLPEQSRLKDFSCQGTSTLSVVQPYHDIVDVMPIDRHKLGFFASEINYDAFDMQGGSVDTSRLGAKPFMTVHDDPACTIGINPIDGDVKVKLNSLFTCNRVDEHISCRDDESDTEVVVRVHGELPVLTDDRTLIVTDPVDIRLSGAASNAALEEYASQKSFDGTAPVTRDDEGNIVAQPVTLGDMQMSVQAGDDDKSLKVNLNKASHVGSFVVLTLDEDVFDACSVRAEAIDTEAGDLEMVKAKNLVDALDADYDGDHGKYYAVEDEFGCQLILTFSHYSEKEITLHSAGDADEADGGIQINIPGFEVVAMTLALLGGVAVVRLRRSG